MPINPERFLKAKRFDATDFIMDDESDKVKSQLRPDLASTAAGKGAELVGFKQSGTGAVARTAQDKMRETVSVKDFGAVGDGVTDDGPAVLAALQYQQSSGVTLIFGGPESVYKLTTWSVFSAVNQLSLVGTGASIVGPSTTTKFLKPLNNVFIENLAFDTWGGVLNNAFADASAISSFAFTRNKLTNVYTAIAIETEFQYLDISNNEFSECFADAIRLGNNDPTGQDRWKRIHINSNTIRNLTHNNFDVRGILVYGKDAEIIGNVIDGVVGRTPYETHAIYTKCRNTTIMGNVLRGVSTGTVVGGITLKGSIRSETISPQGFGSVISSNAIHCGGTTGVGIRVYTDDVLVIGNMIDDPIANGSGIAAEDGDFSRHIITNNILYGTGRSGTVAIRQVMASDISSCTHNVIDGYVTGIRVSGGNNSKLVITSYNILNGCGISFNPGAGITMQRVEMVGNNIEAPTLGIRIDSGRPTDMVVKSNNIKATTPISWSAAAQPTKLDLQQEYRIQTTAGSTITPFGWTLAEESTVLIEAQYLAKQDTTAENAAYWKRALITRDTGGAATLIGATQSVTPDLKSAGATAWTANIVAASSDARVQVLGATATNIDWAVSISMKVS